MSREPSSPPLAPLEALQTEAQLEPEPEPDPTSAVSSVQPTGSALGAVTRSDSLHPGP